MWCVQRRACPHPLHLNLLPPLTPLINYAGTFGSVGSPTLGERGCLALSRSLGLGEFLTQLPDRRRQTRNLILLSADQGDQLPVLTGWRVSVCTHGQSIKT